LCLASTWPALDRLLIEALPYPETLDVQDLHLVPEVVQGVAQGLMLDIVRLRLGALLGVVGCKENSCSIVALVQHPKPEDYPGRGLGLCTAANN
jgi:hypothetical protein